VKHRYAIDSPIPQMRTLPARRLAKQLEAVGFGAARTVRDIGLVMIPFFKSLAHAAESSVLTLATLVWVIGVNSMPAIAYGQAMALRAVVLDSSYKLRPSEPLPPGANTITLEGARNEFEMGQLVLSSSEAIGDVSVELTPLSSPAGQIPAQDVELFLVHYVTVDTPSDSRGQAGSWPDALVPLRRPFPLKAGSRQSVMLKVFLRPEVKAGIYHGRLLVATGGVQRLAIEVSVQVWDITLPKQVSLPVMVGVDYESVRKFEGGQPDPAFEERIVPKYYAALRRHRAYPLFLHNGVPDIREEDGKLIIGFDSYERRLEAAFPGRAWGPTGIPFFDSWPVDTANHPPFSETYRRLALSYLRQMAAFYDGLGLLDRAFLHIPSTDEPIEKHQYDQVRRFAELVRVADPRLRMLLTVFMECLDCRSDGLESLEHSAVLWVPNLAFFDGRALRFRLKLFGLLGSEYSPAPSGWTPEFAERVRRRGGEVWWYLNPWTSVLPAVQQPAYPNIYIDHQGIEHRVLGWMAFKYRVGAIGHWNATFWQKTSNPWTRLPRGEENPENPPIAGDGSLLYPAADSSRHTGQPDPGGPVVSLRLEMLREGSEDYELLNLLTQRGKDTLAMEIAGGVVKSLQEFERRPSEYQLARRKLAAAVLNQYSSPAMPARRP